MVVAVVVEAEVAALKCYLFCLATTTATATSNFCYRFQQLSQKVGAFCSALAVLASKRSASLIKKTPSPVLPLPSLKMRIETLRVGRKKRRGELTVS